MATALPPTITDALVTLTYAGVVSGVSAGQYFGYCRCADVRYEFANISEFSDLTAINTTSQSIIAQEITAAAIELQEMLDPYYVMPYTGTNGPILMKLLAMNAKLAVANLVDHYFQGGEPNVSAYAAMRRAWVELQVVDLKDGVVRWDAPFGDATARAINTVYDPSTGATILGSSPLDPDPNNNTPIFSLGRSHWRPDMM